MPNMPCHATPGPARHVQLHSSNQISRHHRANTALSLTAAGISSNTTSTFHILPSSPPCPRDRLPPMPAGTSSFNAISRSHACPATPRFHTLALPPMASMPAVEDCTRCLPTNELYSSYAMAKFTVSVCATISNLAAAMSIPSSRSAKADNSCSRESGGASEVVCSTAVGLFSARFFAESQDSGSIHSVKNAAADFVVKK